MARANLPGDNPGLAGGSDPDAPNARLYVLRLRPKADAGEVRNSWKPVALLYGCFLGIALLAIGPNVLMERRQNRAQEQKEANLTEVDPGSWKGSETFDALRVTTSMARSGLVSYVSAQIKKAQPP
jgi:hypothetical protein